jgi:ankyrin repeat protein
MSFSCLSESLCATIGTKVAPSGESLTDLLRRFEPDDVIAEHIASFPRSLRDVDKNKKTVLMWAVEKGRDEVVADVIKHGAGSLNAQDNDGWTATMYAARRGNIDVLKTLLDAGCDLNIASHEDKLTALHLAAGNELIDVCLALVRAGAHPNLKDVDGRPPSYYLKVPKNKWRLQDVMDVTYSEGKTASEVNRRRSNSESNPRFSMHGVDQHVFVEKYGSNDSVFMP